MTEYLIYKATHPDGHYYIGYTSKSLSERIREHRLNCCPTTAHTSTDRLSVWAMWTQVMPKDWSWEIIATAHNLKTARYWKYKAVSNALTDEYCLNIRGKYMADYNRVPSYE